MFCWENKAKLNKIDFSQEYLMKDDKQNVPELLDFKIFWMADAPRTP